MELGEQVVVWPHPVLRHLPVREDGRHESPTSSVSARAIVRVGNRALGVVSMMSGKVPATRAWPPPAEYPPVCSSEGHHIDEASVIRRPAADVCVLLLVRDQEGDHLGSSPCSTWFQFPSSAGTSARCQSPTRHLSNSPLEARAPCCIRRRRRRSRLPVNWKSFRPTARVVEEGAHCASQRRSDTTRLRHSSFRAQSTPEHLDDRFPAVAVCRRPGRADRRDLRPVL